MLRHTYVTTMLDAGVGLRDVQIAARHASTHHHALRPSPQEPRPPPQLHPRCLHGLGDMTPGPDAGRPVASSSRLDLIVVSARRVPTNRSERDHAASVAVNNASEMLQNFHSSFAARLY